MISRASRSADGSAHWTVGVDEYISFETLTDSTMLASIIHGGHEVVSASVLFLRPHAMFSEGHSSFSVPPLNIDPSLPH